MTTLHIHLFGQLRLFWEERPYPFKALPKVEPILAYLLLNQDFPVERDSLAFRLWPDVSENQAKARLRRHLYDLRRALPPAPEDRPWLLITPQTVRWNPAASYWLDVAAFEHLSQQPGRLAEAITRIICGSGFAASSQAQWNGANRATTYISSSAISIQLTTAEFNAETAVIQVENPTPGGGVSNPFPYQPVQVYLPIVVK
jgi:hypothetical protein